MELAEVDLVSAVEQPGNHDQQKSGKIIGEREVKE